MNRQLSTCACNRAAMLASLVAPASSDGVPMVSRDPSPAAMMPRAAGGYFTSQEVAESKGEQSHLTALQKRSPACRGMTDSKTQPPVRCRLVRRGFAMTWKPGTAFVFRRGEERSRGTGFRWREPAELWGGQGSSGMAVKWVGGRDSGEDGGRGRDDGAAESFEKALCIDLLKLCTTPPPPSQSIRVVRACDCCPNPRRIPPKQAEHPRRLGVQ